MAEVKCMNPWEVQSIRQYAVDGVYPALPAGSGGGQCRAGICYAIDQQGGKSNAGYAEDVMMTILSDSHGTPHGVCYSIEGHIVDRNTSQNGKGWAVGYAHTLNSTDRHAVCYGVDCRNATLDTEKTHTIQAKPGGGVSANCTPSVLMEK